MTTGRRVLAAALAIAALAAAFALGGWMHGRHATPHAEPAPVAGEAPAAAHGIWTCSMHPQVRRDEPGSCPICGMDLIPVESEPSAGDGGTAAGAPHLRVSESALARMQVRTTPVERRFVESDVRLVGKVDLDETRIAALTAWVPGRITRQFVDYTGVTVAKGDHMVELYSPELRVAQEELLRAVAATRELAGARASVRASSEALLEAAREKLRLWGLTGAQIRAIERRGTAEDSVVIYAPMGGVVTERHSTEGAWVQTGTRLYTIADLSHLWVLLEAYESDLAWLHYGQSVSFSTEAHPGESFEGRIAFIAPVVDDVRRTAKVRVNVANPDGLLKPGMFVRAVARARVATDGRAMDPELTGKWIGPMHPEIVKDGPGTCDLCGMPLVPAEQLGFASTADLDAVPPLVVPASAVLVTGKRAVVYVRVPGADAPTFEGREVELGPRAGDHYLVRSGLAEGELVVTRGAFKIDSALQIRAEPSMMSPSGGDAAPAHPHGHDHG